ncbi:MAG: hypothetical protein AAGI08_09335 [Bacteroidota bacterium]
MIGCLPEFCLAQPDARALGLARALPAGEQLGVGASVERRFGLVQSAGLFAGRQIGTAQVRGRLGATSAGPYDAIQGGFAWRQPLVPALWLEVNVEGERVGVDGRSPAWTHALAIGVGVRVAPAAQVQLRADALAPADHASRLNASLEVHLSSAMSAWIALEKDVRRPASLRVAFEHVLAEVLALRAGWQDQPAMLTLGLGLRTGKARVDFAGYRHAALGWSEALGVWWGDEGIRVQGERVQGEGGRDE